MYFDERSDLCTQMADRWTDPANCEDDFKLLSDLCDPGEEVPPLQISPHVRTVRARPTLYDDDFFDSRPPCRPTRGHPLLRGEGNLLPPGGSPTFLEQQNETTREIREICALGFSNELIEHTLRQGVRQQEKQSHRMPNIALSRSSANSSPSSTPHKDKSKGGYSGTPSPTSSAERRGHSGTSSPTGSAERKGESSGTSSPTGSAERKRGNFNTPSPTGSAEKSSNVAPPIYDILRARRERDCNSYTHSRSMVKTKMPSGNARSNAGNGGSYFQVTSKPEKALDINSRTDFPDLC